MTSEPNDNSSATENDAPQAIDVPAEALQALCKSINWDRIGRQHVLEIAGAAQVVVPALGARAQDAARYLENLIPAVTTEILARHRAYGRVRWLWYIRRLPDSVFSGTYSTTIAYDRTLAEALSWHFDGADTSVSAIRIAFRVDESTARHLCRFVSATRFLSHLHMLYRRVGKGAVLDLTERIPFAITPPDVEDAIRLYDRRHEAIQSIELSGLGTCNAPADTRRLQRRSEDSIADLVYLLVPCSPLAVPVFAPDEKGEVRRQIVTARHLLEEIPVSSLFNPYLSREPPSLPYMQEVEPLVILLMLFGPLAAAIPWALSGALLVGYFFCSDRVFRSLVNDWLPALRAHLVSRFPSIDWSPNYTEWRTRLDTINPGLWPLIPGGIIRKHGEHLMIDINAASGALLRRVASDRTRSELANERADAFELEVQRMIDRSSWKPSDRLANLRGKVLRLSGTALTDIDSVGASAGTLLLVSCKSLIYDPDYDRGVHRVVRNAQETVDDAVRRWAEIVGTLHAHPTGDNYDLSGFAEIVGLVCTPFPVYSTTPQTSEFVADGLRACVSGAELRQWLSGGADPGSRI